MPIIDLTCAPRITEPIKERLVAALPDLISQAVACADEPYDGALQVGDVVIRFHDTGPLDRFDLDVLVEVKSKWFADRASDRQRRADEIRAAVSRLVPAGYSVGVYLTLPVAAWSQTY